MLEQAEQLGPRRRPRVGKGDPFGGGPVEGGGASERRGGALGFQPFIAEQQHGLRQAQRGEVRADRRGEDRIGKGDRIVVEAASLGPEQHAGALGPRSPPPQLGAPRVQD